MTVTHRRAFGQAAILRFSFHSPHFPRYLAV
jgi:hypothetical protein